MQALYAANATGLAPPVFHGNWRQAAAARLRWFDTAGGPNGARTDAWCAPAAAGQSPLADTSVYLDMAASGLAQMAVPSLVSLKGHLNAL